MCPALPGPQYSEENESESANLVDLRLIAQMLGYARASVRRHVRLVVGLSLGIFVAAILSVVLLPKSYVISTKLLAQRNSALALKGDQGGDANPTHTAVETIMRRDNLTTMVRQTDLIHQWYVRRAPLPHLKDVILKHLLRAETEDETVSWMADVLDKRMTVSSVDGVVTIVLDWPDPIMGMALLGAAQQNYLESRHAIEITAIGEQVAILENHATTMRADVDAAVDAIEKLRAERLANPIDGTPAPKPGAAPSGSAKPATPGPVAAAPPPKPAGPDPELTQLKVMIEAKQRAISDLEDFRRKRLSELNAELAEKRSVYTDNHPIIQDLKQTIASLSTESPQVTALRGELAALQKDFADKSAQALAEHRAVPVLTGGPAAPPPLPGSIIRIEQEPADQRDPGMVYARGQLKDAMDKYAALRTQIEQAQIDFDTAEAAFKYRYSVVEPPLYPKKPTKPNVPLVIIAGLLGGLLVSLFAAIAIDIRSGRFLHSWQVERALDLPLLAEIDYAQLSEHRIDRS